jgi:hypothetical protein
LSRAAGVAGGIWEVGFIVNSTVKADARFLRRIFLGLVLLTTIAGGLAAYTTVQAMTAQGEGNCLVFCE